MLPSDLLTPTVPHHTHLLDLPPFFRRNAFVITFTALFFVLNLRMVLDHAMWRDEWAVIQVGHHRSLIDMYNTMSHSGHPVGWFACAWAFDHLGLNPWGIKVFHVLISTTCIWLFLRYSPFTSLEKVLFVFGYFPFFEYGGRVRDYAAAMLALTIACIVFTSAVRRPIAFGLALAFAAQTNSYGTIVGVAMGVAYLFDLWWDRRPEPKQVQGGRIAIGMAIALFSMFVAYWHTRPLSNGFHGGPAGPGIPTPTLLLHGVGNIWSAYFPIPFRGIWDTNILLPSPEIQFALGIVLFIAVVFLLLRAPTALLFYIVATLELVAFNAIHPSGIRHYGHLFVVLILSFWMDGYNRKVALPRNPFTDLQSRWEKHRRHLLIAILCTQTYAGITMSLTEAYVPFSGSLEAAEIIQQNFLPETPIVGDIDYAVAPVSAYLDRPIFIPYRDEYCTYCKEDPRRRFSTSTLTEIAAAVNKLMLANHHDVALITNYPMNLGGSYVERVAVVQASMVQDEVFAIYRIRYHDTTGAEH